MALLENEKIRLRATEPEDVDQLMAWENDTDLWPISYTLAPLSRFQIEQYVLGNVSDIAANRQLRLMITKKEHPSEQSIGTIDLFDYDAIHRRAGLGIMLDKRHRGSGFASAALDLVFDYSRLSLGLHQLYAHVLAKNEKSNRLFQSKGFFLSGRLADWNHYQNGYEDMNVYQIILSNA